MELHNLIMEPHKSIMELINSIIVVFCLSLYSVILKEMIIWN